jgi:hypothetical protein
LFNCHLSGRLKVGGRSRRAGIAACIKETAGWNGLGLKQISAFAAGAKPTKPFQLHAGRARTEKRLRMSEIYSVWLYRCAFR